LGLESWANRAGDQPAEDASATDGMRGRFQPPDPEELAGHFPQLEILELLGVGVMGAVYKARQPGLDRLVALKILPPEVGRDPAFAERFAREARAMARLTHPNILAIHDSGQAAEFYYFVMEFVDGVNLRQTFATGELTPQQALAVVPQICDALQYAHDEGIVHRDIKPENILLDKRGRVKIADFGLAKLLGKAPAEFTLTGTGQVMGTLHYMAPEQMERPLEVDHRVDIYSLGVVFYEMLTGELPIGRFAPPSKKARVDVRLDEVVLRALENAPERRYQHASQIKTDVESVGRQTEPQAAAAGQSPPPLVYRLFVVALATVLVVALVSNLAAVLPLLPSLLRVSTIVLWLLAVVLLVIPSVATAWYFRGTRLGRHAKFWAVLLTTAVVWCPLFFLLVGFATVPQPTLDWLYEAGGTRPAEHDVTVIRTLRIASGVGLLGICCYGCLVLWQRFHAQRRSYLAREASPDVEALTPARPQICKLSVGGAIWAAMGLIALGLTFMVASTSTGEPPEVTVWQWIARFTILPLGVLAPFGCTALGCLGISRIRSSRGRLIGMPLAVAVALLYPLLVLDGALLFFGYSLADGSEYWRSYLAVTALIILALDAFIIRAVWKAAAKPAHANAPI
jgi:predicted Ser/Thr protein kinase